MRFHVPQFIEVESKIFGPFTLKQFIYLAGGGGLATLIWFFVPWTFVSILLIIPVIGLSLALTFYRINGKPFIEIMEAAFYYMINSRLYIWKRQAHPREQAKPQEQNAEEEKEPGMNIPRMSQSKLQEMTWDLDVNAGSSVKDEDEVSDTPSTSKG